MKKQGNIYLAAIFMALFFSGLYIVGCGGDGGVGDGGVGDGGGGNGVGSSTGTLTLSVTDSPVDVANRVVVVFSGVEVKPADGDSVSFTFDEDREIDLLAQAGGESEVILNSVTLGAGRYNWVRLAVRAEKGTVDSFIELEDLTIESLYVPSGGKTGLKVNTSFNVPAGGEADFTVDFDLRKSVHDPEGFDDYILRPTLRIVDNTEVGSIAGTVVSSLLDPGGGNAVYVYEGPDVGPDDIGSGTEPVNTAVVDEATGEYKAGFLLEGVYTVAFTNEAGGDDPSGDDEIEFHQPANVSVTAGETTTHNID
jgi:hypothetical protein